MPTTQQLRTLPYAAPSCILYAPRICKWDYSSCRDHAVGTCLPQECFALSAGLVGIRIRPTWILTWVWYALDVPRFHPFCQTLVTKRSQSESASQLGTARWQTMWMPVQNTRRRLRHTCIPRTSVSTMHPCADDEKQRMGELSV